MTATSPYLNAPSLSLSQHVERLKERLALAQAAWERARQLGNIYLSVILSDRMDCIEDEIEACEAEIAGRRSPRNPFGARGRRELNAVMEELFPGQGKRLADEYRRQLREQVRLFDDGPDERRAAE
jgi:hypothetical protein